jgi:hypothetical protein
MESDGNGSMIRLLQTTENRQVQKGVLMVLHRATLGSEAVYHKDDAGAGPDGEKKGPLLYSLHSDLKNPYNMTKTTPACPLDE